MSTHDYVIDSQSAPAFRADMNNVLAAIASQNSSGTAPTVTFANMIWYDTANNQIKKRNEANSDWIVLGTIDETAGTFTPSGERALATQVQAETGTDNATLMTPLRVAQAIDAQVVIPDSNSIILLGTINTTSGNSQSLTGLNLSGYNMLHIFLDGISGTGGSFPANIWITASGNTLFTTPNPQSAVDGYAVIDLGDGQYGSIGADGRAGNSGVTTASTSVRIGITATSLDAGNVRIYGAK